VTDWPEGLTVGPLREWPGTPTADYARIRSPFEATLTSTLTILHREISQLVDNRQQRESAELLVAVPADRFRLDGRPRAGAVATHPGVVFSLDSRHGHLSYPCDTFLTWEHNLRAIALALEALRKVDRYGVTRRGEQYRGFLAIESGASTTAEDAAGFIRALSGMTAEASDRSGLRQALRVARANAHPDRGGDVEVWHKLSAAERVLQDGGLL
jgi:hypothetical protein